MRLLITIPAGLLPLLFNIRVDTAEGLVACGACVFVANILYSSIRQGKKW